MRTTFAAASLALLSQATDVKKAMKATPDIKEAAGNMEKVVRSPQMSRRQ